MTPKQQRFVEEYLIDLNATQAAIRAGYSAKTAYSIGEEILRKPEVAAALSLAQAARAIRTEITQDRVLAELARIGFADVRRLFTEGGTMITPSDLDDEIAPAVASVEVVERRIRGEDDKIEVEHVRKIRLNDKLGALTQIGRHLGMFVDKVELSGKVGLAERLEGARRRVEGQ